MPDRVNINLGNVQKTLFLPLWGRAVETRKKHPLLVDETAVKIIDQVDYNFSQITQNMDELSQIAWIKRSLICDQVVKKFLMSYPEGSIVNHVYPMSDEHRTIDDGIQSIFWNNGNSNAGYDIYRFPDEKQAADEFEFSKRSLVKEQP